MAISITSISDAIIFAYQKYLNKAYIVNRKYQRKLVWSLEEKKSLIDSLFCQYSIPLFLFAEEGDGASKRYEIIDGMQRLNAIFSFIENDFPIILNGEKGYFDLETLPDTLSLKKSGKLVQKKPILPREECTKMTNYPLSISIITAGEKDIETVFRRINSYGRQLSEQEIRLAGAVGKFPDLVRKISAAIRGDDSASDRMSLNDMAQISLSNGDLRYGIHIGKTYWVRNNIIIPEKMRTSRDEELVGQILAYILMGKNTKPTRETLDNMYHYNERDTKFYDVSEKIARYGETRLNDDFMTVHNILAKAIDKSKMDLRTLLYSGHVTKGFFRAYQILFLSIFTLVIDQGNNSVDYNGLVRELKGLGAREFLGLDQKVWKAEDRQSKIEAICGILGKYFKRSSHKDVVTENWIQQLESLLTRSLTEGTQYDFKIGCHNLASGAFDPEQVKKWVKTLIAEVNQPNSIGYVILGVADKKTTADNHKTVYGSEYKTHPNGHFFITGVEGEIKKYYKENEDNYQRKIIKTINELSDVDEIIKKEIISTLKSVNYYDHTVIILQLKSGNEPYSFEKKYYIREGNNCKEQSQPMEIAALFKAFSNNN